MAESRSPNRSIDRYIPKKRSHSRPSGRHRSTRRDSSSCSLNRVCDRYTPRNRSCCQSPCRSSRHICSPESPRRSRPRSYSRDRSSSPHQLSNHHRSSESPGRSKQCSYSRRDCSPESRRRSRRRSHSCSHSPPRSYRRSSCHSRSPLRRSSKRAGSHKFNRSSADRHDSPVFRNSNSRRSTRAYSPVAPPSFHGPHNSSISSVGRISFEEHDTERAARWERNDTYPDPPIPEQFAPVQPPSVAQRSISIARPSISQSRGTSQHTTMPPSRHEPSSIDYPKGMKQSVTSIIPTGPKSSIGRQANAMLQNYSAVSHYQVPKVSNAQFPVQPPIAYPLHSTAPVASATRAHKHRPSFHTTVRIRGNLLGPQGSFVRQLEERYQVHIKNQPVNNYEMEIRIEAKGPVVTQEGEDRADFVYNGVKLWAAQSVAATTLGAAYPRSIFRFFDTWQGVDDKLQGL